MFFIVAYNTVWLDEIQSQGKGTDCHTGVPVKKNKPPAISLYFYHIPGAFPWQSFIKTGIHSSCRQKIHPIQKKMATTGIAAFVGVVGAVLCYKISLSWHRKYVSMCIYNIYTVLNISNPCIL